MEESTDNSGLFGRIKNSFGHDDVHPRFGIDENKEKSTDGSKAENSTRSEANNAAADSLKNVESAAGAETTQDEGARQAEERAGGFYSGSGKSPVNEGKSKGKFKKAGPLVGILVPALLMGGFFLGGPSNMLFAWVANMNIDLNQSSAVLSMRVYRNLKSLMNSDKEVPEELKTKLKENGIDIVDTKGKDGGKLRMLVYTDANEEKVPIVISDKDLDRIPGSFSDAELGDVTLSNRRFTFEGARKDLSGFRASFDTATVTMTGRTVGWYDSTTKALLKRIGGSSPRNKLRKLGDNPTQDEVKEFLYKNTASGSDNSNTSGVKKEDGEDEEGNPRRTDVETGDFNNVENTESNGDDSLRVGETDTAKVETKLRTTATKAALGGNVACAALQAVGAVNAVVAGIHLANIVDFALKVFEVSDKTRDIEKNQGKGDNTINVVNDLLSTSSKSTAYDLDGNEVTLEGATTESKGWNNAFSDTNIVSENDPGALMMNREYTIKNALRNMDYSGLGVDIAGFAVSAGTSVTAFRTCMGIQAAMGVLDGVTDLVLIFTTAGVGNALKAFLKGIFTAGVAIAAVTAITTAIALIAPMVAHWLADNLEPVFSGILGGYGLDSAAHIVFVDNLMMTAGVNASEQQALELYGATKEIQEEWIAYERETLSPFDTTSRYTFLGSLAYSFMPIVNKLSGFKTSFVNSSLDLLGDSIVSLSGQTVSAANDVDSFRMSMSSGDNCPSLSGMGVAGDAYCNKYGYAYVDDLKTLSSEEIYENVNNEYDCFDGVDSNGNYKIKDGSTCAKYVIACMTNDAQPGQMNAVVQGYISEAEQKLSGGTVAGSTLLNLGSNFVPGAGFIDALDAGEQMANIEWNSQEACSNSKYRYISDFFVDQRANENIGLIKQSAVSVFLDEYYEQNPIDNSYEGTIARYSGLTKEEVTDTLALIDYVNYLAQYNPSERYAFGDDGVELKAEPMFDNDNELGGEYIIMNEIVYADVRNRSFAV